MSSEKALITWAEPVNSEALQDTVENAKKQYQTVQVENLDRLGISQLTKSSFDAILSNVAPSKQKVSDTKIKPSLEYKCSTSLVPT